MGGQGCGSHAREGGSHHRQHAKEALGEGADSRAGHESLRSGVTTPTFRHRARYFSQIKRSVGDSTGAARDTYVCDVSDSTGSEE